LFPIEVRLGPFAINPYGVLAAVGVFAGWLLARAEARRILDLEFLERLVFAALLSWSKT
jgi:prolipoprotein diacylglyceryltransferase